VTLAPDRRAALRARHRSAILAAARALIAESDDGEFGVDELARRADVSRRTVFNHFASLDEIVVTVGAQELDFVIDDFIAAAESTPVGDGSRSSMFEELASTLVRADLATAIARIATILGVPEDKDPRGKAMTETAFSRTADRLVAELERRNPTADHLDVELLVAALLNGVMVIAKHWVHESNAVVSPETRARWDELLARLLTSVRGGYPPGTV
jgi:TetR/AcrR family transcriptional regulator, regulator of autoinduction and epiphytic fitness